MEMTELLQDGFYACLAAIGFGSINNPPRRLLIWCGMIAAVGHATRYYLMHCEWQMNIVIAGFIAAAVIGLLSDIAAHHKHCPSEIFSFPALLPMIPGMYAYGTVQALVLYIYQHQNNGETGHYLDLFIYNGTMTLLIILMMVVGLSVPRIFRFTK